MALKKDAASVRDRERQALELRNAHVPYQQIADQVGYASAGAARDAILRCYERDIVQNVDEIRATELSGLASLEQALYPKARRGDEKAIDAILRIKTRRAKYLGGLEVPELVQVDLHDSTDERTQAALQALAELEGKRADD